MDMLTFLPYLLVMAGVTYLIRALPFVLVNKKIENRFLNSFLYYIPYTVLAAMTFPAILYGTNHMISAIAGLAEGDILVEATEYAETGGGSGSDPIPAAPRYTPNMVVGAAKEFTGKGLPTIDAAYEAVVLYPSLNFPLLEDWLINPGKVCLKANPNILFIKQ